MANEEHVRRLIEGVEISNDRRVSDRRIQLDLRGADLRGVDLGRADLDRADLSFSNLEGVNLAGADLCGANLAMANLSGAKLGWADLSFSNLDGANLAGADLMVANLMVASLSGAVLIEANLGKANLYGANLDEADLSGANLVGALLVETSVDRTTFAGAEVYGVAAWGLKGTPRDQTDLRITPYGEAHVTVDDLEVAQFVYVMLHSEKVRRVIDTIGAKGVLVLGRFGERKQILDKLRDRLRELGFVPMVFDFERPEDRHFTGTVRTLASMSAFILADITAPRSVQQEAQATIPDYMVPFIPIIEKGEEPWSMFEDLWRQYEAWVRPPLHYGSIDELLARLRTAVVRPALEMRETLRARLLKPMPGLSLKDFPLDEEVPDVVRRDPDES